MVSRNRRFIFDATFTSPDSIATNCNVMNRIRFLKHFQICCIPGWTARPTGSALATQRDLFFSSRRSTPMAGLPSRILSPEPPKQLMFRRSPARERRSIQSTSRARSASVSTAEMQSPPSCRISWGNRKSVSGRSSTTAPATSRNTQGIRSSLPTCGSVSRIPIRSRLSARRLSPGLWKSVWRLGTVTGMDKNTTFSHELRKHVLGAKTCAQNALPQRVKIKKNSQKVKQHCKFVV